jgi:hypothetical protein
MYGFSAFWTMVSGQGIQQDGWFGSCWTSFVFGFKKYISLLCQYVVDHKSSNDETLSTMTAEKVLKIRLHLQRRAVALVVDLLPSFLRCLPSIR